MHFIDKIKKSVVERVKDIPTFSSVTPNTLDFCQIFVDSQNPCIIAEVKFASPLHGQIYHGKLDSVAIAEGYLINGASALSVLAEPIYFKGDIQYIEGIKSAFPKAHLLLKDFILSEKQIIQGLMAGVNAVLLIVAFLEKKQLETLYHYAIYLGLTPIIEIHNKQELEIALSLNPKVIGINNRNLQTLEVTLDTSRFLARYIPKDVYVVCESGIKNKTQMREMQALGFHGFLIGSSLMKHKSPGEALKRILLGDPNES